ncbi:MAG TPA: hypothetical protein VLL98_02300 [Rickettsiales bacterium]|nr:hypothetical protein [Rickettsiales bacterium]
MINLYYFLSKTFLLIPIFAILGSFTLNKFTKIQNLLNDISYLSFTSISFLLLIFCSMYGEYEFKLLDISINNPISFAINSFNLTFGAIFSICIIFLNYVFQNSFSFLKLFNKYRLYNKQITFLLFFSLLVIFSNNVVISILIYTFILFSSLFLLTNPELKDLRKGYSLTFLVGLISSIIVIMVFSHYFYSNNTLLFIKQNIKDANFNSIYYTVLSFVFLCSSIFVLPIYFFFKQKLYYEDFLPAFIIYFFPFIFLNTFIFIKITYYLFTNEFNNLGLYFYYIGFILAGLFIFSIIQIIFEIKNSLKFTILFNFSNFLIFLSQLLFINSDLELIKVFSNFIILIVAIFCNIFAYSGILFLLLNSNLNSTYFLYKNKKTELNFYILTLVTPLFLNLLFFIKLNFYNFNILYFINLIEIAVLFLLFCIFIYFFLFKKPISKNIPELKTITDLEMLKFFIAPLFMFFLLIIIFYFNNEIIKIILEK